MRLRWGSARDLAWGAYSAPPQSLAKFGGKKWGKEGGNKRTEREGKKRGYF